VPTIDTRIYYPYFKKHYYVSNNFPLPTYVANDSFMRTVGPGFERKTGTSNPDWRVKIAKKQDASSAYYRTKIDCFVKPIYATGEELGVVDHRKAYTYNARWTGPIPTSFPSTDAFTEDVALSILKRKISEHEDHFNSLLPLAELHELRTTFRNSVELATDFLDTVIRVKRKYKDVRYATKYLSKAWLTFGFGIAPVIKDVSDLAKSISEYLLRTDHTAVLEGHFTKQWSSGSSVLPADNPGSMAGTDLKVHSTLVHKLTYMYKGGFNFALSSAVDYGAMRHFGLRLENLTPTAWELIPFSWLMDYFATVGDCLEDTFIGTPVHVLYLNKTRSYKVQGQNRMEVVHRSPPGIRSLVSNPGSCLWSYSEFERTVLGTLPHRVCRFRTIDEIGSYSLRKLLNLAAILGK
jgi:hypothetical protein